MLVLKNSQQSQFPPFGGWSFVDGKTGQRFNGWEGDQFAIARKVIEHRKANPKIYEPGTEGDVNSVVQQIFQQKHAQAPWLFRGNPDQGPGAYPSQPAARETIVKGAACSCGCTEFIAEYCKTCSGARIVGRKCKSCGKAA